MSLHLRRTSIHPARSARGACALLAGLLAAGCSAPDVDPGVSDVDLLDGRWSHMFLTIVDEALTDQQVLAMYSPGMSGFSLELQGGAGFVIYTFTVNYDPRHETPTRCVVRHPITFSYTDAGWTVVEGYGEVLESSERNFSECDGTKDFGIWTSPGEERPLRRINVVGDALLIESAVKVDAEMVITVVFTRSDRRGVTAPSTPS